MLRLGFQAAGGLARLTREHPQGHVERGRVRPAGGVGALDERVDAQAQQPDRRVVERCERDAGPKTSDGGVRARVEVRRQGFAQRRPDEGSARLASRRATRRAGKDGWKSRCRRHRTTSAPRRPGAAGGARRGARGARFRAGRRSAARLRPRCARGNGFDGAARWCAALVEAERVGRALPNACHVGSTACAEPGFIDQPSAKTTKTKTKRARETGDTAATLYRAAPR